MSNLRLVVNNEPGANDDAIGANPGKKPMDYSWLKRAGETFSGMGSSAFKAARYAVYYLLMWLRFLVSPITTICIVVSLIGVVLFWLISPNPEVMWKLAGFSFGCFMFGWLYDSLILFVSPEPIMLDGRPNDNGN